MLRRLINWRVILLGALLGVLLTVTAIIWALVTRPEQAPLPSATAMLAIIPAPTRTPSPTPTQAITPSPTIDAPPPPAEGVIAPGAYVAVSGTGGDGLRLRVEPGLSGTVAFLGLESEVFVVVDGPVEADGYTWWELNAAFTEGPGRGGWGVANFLTVVQSP